MQIKYTPSKGFVYNDNEINWNDSRTKIRSIFGEKHQEDDRIITLDSYFEDEVAQQFNQRRDIYQNFDADENLFFLSYNENDEFIEFEYHIDIDIQIGGVELKQDQELNEIINNFEINSHKVYQTEPGNYVIPSLKISLMDDEYMGGDNGDKLSYFYAAKDISHLEEDLN